VAQHAVADDSADDDMDRLKAIELQLKSLEPSTPSLPPTSALGSITATSALAPLSRRAPAPTPAPIPVVLHDESVR
jgi:hypothetical protein